MRTTPLIPPKSPYGADRVINATASSIKAHGDWIIIHRLPLPDTDANGLALVHVNKVGHEGIVITCGPGKVTCKGAFVETVLKPGDRVVIDKNGDNWETHTIDGKPCIIMREADVVAVIEP